MGANSVPHYFIYCGNSKIMGEFRERIIHMGMGIIALAKTQKEYDTLMKHKRTADGVFLVATMVGLVVLLVAIVRLAT